MIISSIKHKAIILNYVTYIISTDAMSNIFDRLETRLWLKNRETTIIIAL